MVGSEVEYGSWEKCIAIMDKCGTHSCCWGSVPCLPVQRPWESAPVASWDRLSSSFSSSSCEITAGLKSRNPNFGGKKNKQKRRENSLTGTSLTSPEMPEQRGGSEISQKGQTVSQGPHAEKTKSLPKGDITSWSWPWDSFKRLKISKARAIWGGLCRTVVSSLHRFFMVIQKHALVSAKSRNSWDLLFQQAIHRRLGKAHS